MRGIRISPSFDPGFHPLSLDLRECRESLSRIRNAVSVRMAVERESGYLSSLEIEIPGNGGDFPEASLSFIERTVKFLLWSRGGWKIILQAPAPVRRRIEALYAPGGLRAFDADFMSRVYGKPFRIVPVGPED
jgi:hypothetical protein